MHLLPLSLWLLVATQIDAQTPLSQSSTVSPAVALPLPTAVRKMPPDAGAKFFPRDWAFVDEDGDDDETRHADALVRPRLVEAHAAFAARRPFAERDALLLAANASASIAHRPPFAPHVALPMPASRGLAGRQAAALGLLEKRQWSCPGGTSSCDSIGYPNSCCQNGETCVVIQDTGLGPVGCCPSGSTCGGSLSGCPADNTPCGSDVGGGCCIPGYVCAGVGCVSSAAVMTTITSTSTRVVSDPTPSTIVVTVIVTETATQPRATTRTTTRTVAPTTRTGTDISAPVRPTSSVSPSDTSPSSSSATGASESNTNCPTGFYACLASAGGGCCQTGRDCKTTSCPPAPRLTTITNANGVTVVVPAAAVPSASSPSSSSSSCASGWYLCSDVAGCCPSGYGCGTASCLLVDGGATASVAKEQPGHSGAAGRGRGAGLLVAMLALSVGLPTGYWTLLV